MAYIRERKNKDDSISFEIEVSCGYKNGKQARKYLTYNQVKGQSYEEARAEADRLAKNYEDRIKHTGVYEGQIKFKELREIWYESIKLDILLGVDGVMKKGTLQRMYSGLAHAVDYLGDLYIIDIKKSKLQDFVNYLHRECHLSCKSQKNILTSVRDVLYFAVGNNLIESLPNIDAVKIFATKKCKKESDRFYTFGELEEIRKALLEEAPLIYKVFFSIVMDTGMRRGEILALEYDDINYENGAINITKTLNYTKADGLYIDTPKTDAGTRYVYLTYTDIQLVKELKKEQSKLARAKGKTNFRPKCLFANDNGEYMHPNTPYNWFKRFCERNQLPFKDIHAFRHTYISTALYMGIERKQLISLVGHAYESSLKTYEHELESNNLGIGKAIAEFMSNPSAHKKSIYGGWL